MRPRVVLLGQGISYSASPAMHAAAFGELGLDWSYELCDVAPEGLAQAVSSLREPASRGANVTIPHKVAVMPLLDELDARAQAAGAVNTITREGRLLRGSNTDVAGVEAALAEVGLRAAGAAAVVLGAGGSARAAAVALNGARLVFVTRRPGAGAGLPGETRAWEDRAWWRLVRDADLLLNATPLGRQGELPLPADYLPRGGAVIDLVYTREGTPLVQAARQRGLSSVDGWSILLAQGAAAFEAWTGRRAPVAAMRAALPV
jgi:shikimate dehydrogenase